MSLGVLNNLSAVYAQNNLNNTNNSLQSVLRQLSSGSRINSGADDAAGLSLVNGLQANQTALTQSVTNAKEGVGLLQVADGALSQVTSLLNRAVTLATEASNGTLNASQDMAANQEYQSILSEISNIGSTTTYNGQQVFNSVTNIYTGDASMAGSSIDALNIRSLSSSNVGDSGGVMSYSNGRDSVFINLSHTNSGTGAVTNAQGTDTLNASGRTTVNVNYLVKGANGAQSAATTSISVGAGTSFANTANGLVSAINSAGLGLTASFSTQAQAGISGGGNQTGIQITGGLVSAGVDPNAASTSGTLNPAGISNEELTQGQTITVKVGDVVAASVTIGSSTSTLTGLMNAINSNVGGAAGLVTASIVTNGNGSQSLALADTAGGGALTVTTAAAPLGPNALTNGTNSIDPVTLAFNGSDFTTGAAGSNAAATLGFSGTNSGANVLSGSIVLSNSATPGANPVTFVMGGTAGGSAATGTVTLGSGTSTLQDLATAIHDNLGVNATVGAAGITMTSSTGGTTLEVVPGAGNNTLTTVANVSNVTTVAGAASSAGTAGTTTLAMNGDGGQFTGTDTFTAGQSLVLQNGNLGAPGTPITFVIGSGQAGLGTSTVTTGAATVTGLVNTINANSANQGFSAALDGSGHIVLTAAANGTAIGVNSSTLKDNAKSLTAAHTNATTAQAGGPETVGATLLTGVTAAGTDTVTGSIVLTNNGITDTFVMGGTTSAGTVGVTGTTLADLQAAITGASSLGITATLATGDNGGLNLDSTANGNITVGANTLADVYGLTFTSPASGDPTQFQSATLSVADGAAGTQANVSGGTFTGSIVLTNNGVTDTFVMNSAGVDAGNVFNVATGSMADLATKITATGDALSLSASTDGATGGLFLQSTLDSGTTGGDLAMGASTLTDTIDLAGTAGSGGTPTIAPVAASVLFSNSGTNAAGDTVTGNIVLTVGGAATTS